MASLNILNSVRRNLLNAIYVQSRMVIVRGEGGLKRENKDTIPTFKNLNIPPALKNVSCGLSACISKMVLLRKMLMLEHKWCSHGLFSAWGFCLSIILPPACLF